MALDIQKDKDENSLSQVAKEASSIISGAPKVSNKKKKPIPIEEEEAIAPQYQTPSLKLANSINSDSAGIKTVPEDPETESTIQQQMSAAEDIYKSDALGETEKKKNASLLNAFDAVQGTPTEYVTKRAELNPVIGRLTGTGNFIPEEIQFADEKAKVDAVNAAQLNTEYNSVGEASKKLADKITVAEENPDAVVIVNREDIEKAIPDLTDSLLIGDPDVKKKITAFERMAQLDNVRFAEPAVEKLGLQDYYPDISQPLAVGNYSGKVIGSNPIFVAGGQLFPMGVLDARKRAIEGAARRKAAVKDKIIEMVYAKGAAQYQDQLDNMTMNIIQKYGEETNWNWSELASYSSKVSLAFWKEVKDTQSLGKVTMAVQSKADELTKKIAGDDRVYIPKEVESSIIEWNRATFDMETFWKDKKNFNSLVNKFQSFDDMTYYAGNAAKELAAQKDVMPIKIKSGLDMTNPEIATALQDIYTVSYHNDYDRYVKALGKFVDDDRINVIAAGLHKEHKFFGSEEKTKEYITAMIGKEIDLKEEIAKKYNVQLLDLQKKKFESQQQEKMTVWTNINNNAQNPELKQVGFQIAGSNLDDDKKRDALYRIVGENIGMTPAKTADGKQSKKAIFVTNVTPEEQAKNSALSLNRSAVYDEETKRFIKAGDYYNKISLKAEGKRTAQEQNFVDFVKKYGKAATVKGNLYEKGAYLTVRNPDGSLRVFENDDINNQQAIANWGVKGQLKYNTFFDDEINDGTKVMKVKKSLPPMAISFDAGNEVERAQLDALEQKEQRLYKESYQQGSEELIFEEQATPAVQTNFDE